MKAPAAPVVRAARAVGWIILCRAVRVDALRSRSVAYLKLGLKLVYDQQNTLVNLPILYSIMQTKIHRQPDSR